MLITGSALFVKPGTDEEVREKIRAWPEVTFQVQSESGTELVVNLEAKDHRSLEILCAELKEKIPQIVEVTHIYVNFEEALEKMESGGDG